jgi:hypothetical protein
MTTTTTTTTHTQKNDPAAKDTAARGKNAAAEDLEVHEAPEHALPSSRARRRWRVSRAVHDGTDALLRRLAVAGQRINEFTGTDYSGIEALRREIRDHGNTTPHTCSPLREETRAKHG